MLIINTSDIDDSRKVYIKDKDFGGDYTVRPLGAGEELRLSQIARRIGKLHVKNITGEITPDEIEEVNKLAETTLSITYKLYDDGGDGSKSRGLINKLSSNGLLQMHNKIFNPEEIEIDEIESEPTKETS